MLYIYIYIYIFNTLVMEVNYSMIQINAYNTDMKMQNKNIL
jgi:hypothetical protein